MFEEFDDFDLEEEIKTALTVAGFKDAQITPKILNRLKQKAEYYRAFKPKSNFFDFTNRIVDGARCLGISEDDFIKICVTKPDLIFEDPYKIDNNIKRISASLNIEKKRVVKIGLNIHRTFYTDPVKMNARIEKIAQLFEIERSQFIKSALKKPTLFFEDPNKLLENISKLAETLNVNKTDLIKKALHQSALFYSDPDALKKKIENISKSLGIDVDIYIKAAMKQPSLFFQNQYKLKEKYDFIDFLSRRFSFKNFDIQKFFVSTPATFCLGIDNLKLRLIFSRYNNKQMVPKDFKINRNEIESWIANNFNTYASEKRKAHRTQILSHLKKMRYIKDSKPSV